MSQVDNDGHMYSLMSEIVYHSKKIEAVDIDYGLVNHNGSESKKITTKCYYFSC